ncbi:hypothetical protein AMATHDRAFT_75624 [Amanita thiersii Skay4041]|uniref:C2H2-type domain-containing protein n=1 Tax=Amanita thiersii Skay4041 TaxID=703135 RepID=A0A2A9NRL6_9AGAR|nr:hypothetical protein AMATHDRAFT_75624 [Amanita thiersii Skay4041]
MPRAESKPLTAQLYHSQLATTPYPTDPSANAAQQSQQQQQSSQQQQQSSSSTSSAQPKKKHVCPTCDRAFTTSGHLARHSRVHTGERNHKCPFPGCETRCSRQDNLQQHYRIHLSPGSRRSSTRSAIARAMNTNGPSKRGSVSSVDSSSSQPPLTPPALEPARVYGHHSPPPDTPPPLAPATLPPSSLHLADPVSSRSSSSPDAYSAANHHLMPMAPSMSLPGSQSYSYRSGTTTYQEQSQGAGFTYVHTTPLHAASNSFPSYSNGAHGNFGNHNLSHLNSSSPIIHHSRHNPESSMPSISSRHSISHISHPHSYSQQQHQSSSGGPPSPASSHSVSSHTSGPPTPTYPVFHDDGTHSYTGNGMLGGGDQNNNTHMGLSSHLMHSAAAAAAAAYHHHAPSHVQSSSAPGMTVHANGRFVDSPPPTLAPIQDERLIRREDRHSTQSHAPSPYIHHPQPLPTDYPYHQSLSLGTPAWKTESGLRKGIGALVQ